MKKISLFLPSRQRPELLLECATSFFEKAADPKRVEMFVVMDDDDHGNDGFKLWADNTPHSVKYFVRPRSTMQQRDYYSFLAAKTAGDYLWGLNDDTEMRQGAWDDLLEDRVEKFLVDHPRRVAYISPDDTTHVGGKQKVYGCCFPILTREFYSRMGCFMPDEVASWGADIILYHVVQLARIPILWLPELVINHRCYHNRTRAPDATCDHVRSISVKQSLTAAEYQEYARRLNIP